MNIPIGLPPVAWTARRAVPLGAAAEAAIRELLDAASVRVVTISESMAGVAAVAFEPFGAGAPSSGTEFRRLFRLCVRESLSRATAVQGRRFHKDGRQ